MGTLVKENSNHCCFVGMPCDISLPEQDDLKAFLAYPSEDKIKWYMSRLCEQMQLHGLKPFPWEELSDSSGILFW